MNIFLSLGIFGFLLYAIYDQWLMLKIKGDTKLIIRLKPQGKIDSLILIGLILASCWQGFQSQHYFSPLTLFLLALTIICCIYATFIRYPRLVLKTSGFFFGNIYFDYQKIQQINLAEGQILVIDLTSGRRLLVRIAQADDVEKVVNFFGGYKKGETQ